MTMSVETGASVLFCLIEIGIQDDGIKNIRVNIPIRMGVKFIDQVDGLKAKRFKSVKRDFERSIEAAF